MTGQFSMHGDLKFGGRFIASFPYVFFGKVLGDFIVRDCMMKEKNAA